VTAVSGVSPAYICAHHSTQLALEVETLTSRQATGLGQDDESEEGNTLGHRMGMSQGNFITGKEQKLIHVPNIAVAAQGAFDEMAAWMG